MRVGIIAIAKSEELYIREWVEHHLSLGFDEILLADNDDSFLLPGIIDHPAVKHFDYTGIDKVQPKAYTELYQQNKERFDWLLFIDCDEFVMLERDNIKDFLQPFNCDVVRINWMCFSDGDMLDTDGDYRVVSRFTQPYLSGADTFVKSFINTRIELGDRKIYGHGIYDKNLDARNALGDICENTNQHTNRIVHSVCWLNHYPTKTIGEYIRQKYNRGGANGNPGRYTNWETYFFRTNRRTQEKIDYANKIIKTIEND